MFQDLQSEIKFYLASEYPKEGCGLIINPKNPAFIPCENVAHDTTKNFQIARKIKDEFQNKIVAVVHSHPEGLRCPSESDMRGQIEMKVPWGIARTIKNTSENLFWFGDQVEKPPILWRGFRHGTTDCYGLIRDWYLEQWEVELQEFPRSWNWWKTPGIDLYSTGFSQAGFKRLSLEETPQIGDLCLMRIRSKVINHAGILIEDNLLLHHPGGDKEFQPDKLSVKEPIGRWQKHIDYWIRHESQ